MFVRFEAAGADFYAAAAERLWEGDPLKVRILALIPRRVEFCCTDAVRIPSGDAGTLRAQWTYRVRRHSSFVFGCPACYHDEIHVARKRSHRGSVCHPCSSFLNCGT